MAKAASPVSTKTKARKAAKPLQASTAAVKRSAPRKRPSANERAIRRAERERERDNEDRMHAWSQLYDAAKERAATPLMTMEELIVALGGPVAIEEWLGGNNNSWWRWLQFGYVSRGYDLQVFLALTVLGYRHINPKLFGLPSWSDLLPPHMRMPELQAA